MQLVAHVERLCNNGLEVDPSHGADIFFHHGRKIALYPFETAHGVLTERAEADNVACALVEGAVCHIAVFPVLHADHRHGI